MTIEEMKNRKKELGYTNEQVAALTGVPLGTVQKVLGGITSAPRRETLQKLEKLFAVEEKTAYTYPDFYPKHDAMVREEQAAYGTKRQGEYTLEDYYALPEDQRVELIDGYFYEMLAPTGAHQEIIGLLYMEFSTFVRSHGSPCKVFLSPFDVQLDKDNRTMVEPDLLVICDRSKIRMRCCYGAPDLVVEVLSPSTRRKDIRIKTAKYEHAGVREYWMIDPDKRQVMVIDFTKEGFPTIYGFDAKIPVGIWEGELVIDFNEISEEIAYLYENDTE